jgi:uncharacterized protein YbjQ (UPF0145 family)
MLISTMHDVPGYEVTDVLGKFSAWRCGVEALAPRWGGIQVNRGGELKGMAKSLAVSRHEAVDRMMQEAEAKGGNIVVSARFDTSEMGGNWPELCAYGMAVSMRKL